MEQDNNTIRVREFVLLGLSQNPEHQHFLLVILLLIYTATWLENLTIITTVIMDHHLHKPMYFLLASLAFLEISESSITAPKLLQMLLSQDKTISFHQCMIQVFCIHFVGGAVVFVLMLMAADRYLAIHKPLQYVVIMNSSTCLRVVVGAWLGGFFHSVALLALILQLPFCGPNILDNFYCDVPQMVKLACRDTYILELFIITYNGTAITGAFIGLLISYTVILNKIRNHIAEGMHKALSTCSAQIIVVFIHFIPCLFVYDQPFQKVNKHKVSLIYLVFLPMLNPIIYTLRNTEMKNAIRRVAGRIFCSKRQTKF